MVASSNPGPSTLGYLVFGASDLPRWEHFALNLLGLHKATHSTTNALALRVDEHAQRLLIEQGAQDDLLAAGWELDSEDPLERLVAHVQQAGIAVEPGSEALVASRRVKKLYTCIDPNGLRHELYFGPAMAPVSETFRSRVLRSHFIAGRLGVGPKGLIDALGKSEPVFEFEFECEGEKGRMSSKLPPDEMAHMAYGFIEGSIWLPGVLKVAPWPVLGMAHYEWYVPVDEKNHRYFIAWGKQCATQAEKAEFTHEVYTKWKHLGYEQFNHTDLVANQGVEDGNRGHGVQGRGEPVRGRRLHAGVA